MNGRGGDEKDPRPAADTGPAPPGTGAGAQVEVVYATPEYQAVVTVRLRPGATVAQAIAASGLLARFPEIDLARQAVGIHGVRVRASDAVAHGDRVEIYRALAADPKELRRRRARAARRR
jgi:putative ubiquitin-RnfH superfamily antitoxin RatB of RatAB toxin-antitoxin module